MVAQEDFVLRQVLIPNGVGGTQIVDITVESGVITFVGDSYTGSSSNLVEIKCESSKLLLPG